MRSALRLSSVNAQLEARTVSDLGLALMTTYPILVDAAIVAYWYRGSDDVALQMALIDAEAFAVTGALARRSQFPRGPCAALLAWVRNGHSRKHHGLRKRYALPELF